VRVRHLPGDWKIDLTAMVLVVRETFVHLGFRERRKAAAGHSLDRFAVLQKPDDIVDGDPRTLYAYV
jgi:hypothetical protein